MSAHKTGQKCLCSSRLDQLRMYQSRLFWEIQLKSEHGRFRVYRRMPSQLIVPSFQSNQRDGVYSSIHRCKQTYGSKHVTRKTT
jgi:hypothetical protein